MKQHILEPNKIYPQPINVQLINKFSGILLACCLLASCSLFQHKNDKDNATEQGSPDAPQSNQQANISSAANEQQLQALITLHNNNCKPTTINNTKNNSKNSKNEDPLSKNSVESGFDLQTQILADFIQQYCIQSTHQPAQLSKQLDQLKQDHLWSDNTLVFLNLLSWHLNEFSKLKTQTEKLREEMQKTLSALAKVEQMQLNKNLDSSELKQDKLNSGENNEH